MAYDPFWQEDPRQQRGLFFSNAGLLNQGRGGGGMPMGMTSNTTGPAPEQPQEDPMMTAYKMKMMYEGGQKGKKYIGDAWKKGQEWLDKGINVADVTAAKTGSGPLSQTMQFQTQPSVAPTQNIPSVGARKGFLPPQEVTEPMGLWEQPYSDPIRDVVGINTSGDWMNAVPEGYNASGVADFGNISADPLTSGSGSLIQYPQPMNALGLESMPGSAGTLGSGGMFTPGTGALNASTGVFTPTGGKLLGDAVGQGTMYSNVPKGAGGGMGSALGALGSAAGVGLNIYDMTEQGITPGNMMGMLGSGMLGASALGGLGIGTGAMSGLLSAGALNAWNPVGWALLAGSVAGSLFDWW